jgi:hypothetical protein
VLRRRRFLFLRLCTELFGRLRTKLFSRLRTKLFSRLRTKLFGKLRTKLFGRLRAELFNVLRRHLADVLPVELLGLVSWLLHGSHSLTVMGFTLDLRCRLPRSVHCLLRSVVHGRISVLQRRLHRAGMLLMWHRLFELRDGRVLRAGLFQLQHRWLQLMQLVFSV